MGPSYVTQIVYLFALPVPDCHPPIKVVTILCDSSESRTRYFLILSRLMIDLRSF